MEIEFKGGNCVAITHKKDVFVSDPNLNSIGLKDQGLNAVAQLLTERRFASPANQETLIVDRPGEYEVRNCSIKGIPALAHIDDPTGPKNATLYRLDIDDFSIALLGHINPTLSEDQLENIGVVDILVLPVGGQGYTLDAKGAADIVKSIGPKIVIPTHYADEGVKYEVPQAPLSDFIKELGVAHESIPKLKLKSNQLPEALVVYELLRSK